MKHPDIFISSFLIIIAICGLYILTTKQNEHLSQQIKDTQTSMEFLVTEQCALLIK